MSSTLENEFSLLIADLLRNELTAQTFRPRQTARRNIPNNTTRSALFNVITEYTSIIGYYNRNMETLIGLLNNEVTHSGSGSSENNTNIDNTNDEPNSTSIEHIDTPPETQRESYSENRNHLDISSNTTTEETNRYVTGNPYATDLFSLSNLSRLWGRPRSSTNVYRDYMLYINTMPLYSTNSETNMGLTPEEIESATVEIEYDDTSSNMVSTQCPISFDDFRDGEIVLKIRHCGHIFKPEELRRWLTRHQNCPVCRYNLQENANRRATRRANTHLDEGSESDDYDDVPDLI
jgi:uncharacterized C2H2 Zn-finger protein